MTTYEDLLKTCLLDRDDDTPRHVLADFVREGGDETRADFILTQLARSQWRRDPRALTQSGIRRRTGLVLREWKLLEGYSAPYHNFERWSGVSERTVGELVRCRYYPRGGLGRLLVPYHYDRGFLTRIDLTFLQWFREAGNLYWHPKDSTGPGTTTQDLRTVTLTESWPGVSWFSDPDNCPADVYRNVVLPLWEGLAVNPLRHTVGLPTQQRVKLAMEELWSGVTFVVPDFPDYGLR